LPTNITSTGRTFSHCLPSPKAKMKKSGTFRRSNWIEVAKN